MDGPLQIAEIDAGPFESEDSQFALLQHGISIDSNALAIQVQYQSVDHLQYLRSQSHKRNKSPVLSWTYADMQFAALKIVNGLRTLGIRHNSTLITLVPNGLEWALLYWASMIGKFTFVSLDPDALTELRSAELENLLMDTLADGIVTPDPAGAAAVNKALFAINRRPAVKIVLKPDGLTNDWVDFATMASVGADDETRSQLEMDALDHDVDRCCQVIFTSGTTSSESKGCPWTVRAFTHTTQMFDWGRYHGPGIKRALTSANFRAIAPLAAASTWWSGGCLVLPSIRFSPPDLLLAIEHLRVHTFLLVPAMVHALIAHSNFAQTDLTSLKSILCGGDILTRDLYAKARKAFPGVDFFTAHGMSEGTGVFQWPLHGWSNIDDIPFHDNIAPLGKVQRGAHLKVVDENNQAVLRSQVGELHICSPGMVRGYQKGINHEDFYVVSGKAWFKTGDIGMINDAGWVYILGRKKDIIKRAGVTIRPAALESALGTFLNSQTSVIAVPDPVLGQQPFAVVRELNGLSKEEIMQHILDLFGEAISMRGVATLGDLGLTNFPVTTTGKILKRELEAPVAEYLMA